MNPILGWLIFILGAWIAFQVILALVLEHNKRERDFERAWQAGEIEKLQRMLEEGEEIH